MSHPWCHSPGEGIGRRIIIDVNSLIVRLNTVRSAAVIPAFGFAAVLQMPVKQTHFLPERLMFQRITPSLRSIAVEILDQIQHHECKH